MSGLIDPDKPITHEELREVCRKLDLTSIVVVATRGDVLLYNGVVMDGASFGARFNTAFEQPVVQLVAATLERMGQNVLYVPMRQEGLIT